MNTHEQRVALCLICGMIGIYVNLLMIQYGVLPYFFGYGPVVRKSSFAQEMQRIKTICLKLEVYAETHKALPEAEATRRSIDGLVGAGIISMEDAAYLRDHQIKFHGFNPAHMSADTVIFETVFADTPTQEPRHIVCYDDGHINARVLGQE